MVTRGVVIIIMLTTLFLQATPITIESVHIVSQEDALYSDGGMQSIYSFVADVKTNTTASLVLKFAETYEEGRASGVLTIGGVVRGYYPHYTLRIKWQFNNSLTLDVRANEWYGMTLLVNGYNFTISAYAPALDRRTGYLAAKALAVVQRMPYIAISNISVKEEWGIVYVNASGCINKTALLNYARGVCLYCNESVTALSMILSMMLDGETKVSGGGAVYVEVRPVEELGTVIDGYGAWHAEGDIRQFDSLLALASDAVMALLEDATFGVLDMPSAWMWLLLPRTAVVDGKFVPLIRVPPSNSTLTLIATPYENGTRVYIKYVTHRLAPANLTLPLYEARGLAANSTSQAQGGAGAPGAGATAVAPYLGLALALAVATAGMLVRRKT